MKLVIHRKIQAYVPLNNLHSELYISLILFSRPRQCPMNLIDAKYSPTFQHVPQSTICQPSPSHTISDVSQSYSATLFQDNTALVIVTQLNQWLPPPRILRPLVLLSIMDWSPITPIRTTMQH